MKFHRIHMVTIVLVVALLGLIVVQGFMMNLRIKVAKERFHDLAGQAMLEIHHSVEDDKYLSGDLIQLLHAYEQDQALDDVRVQTVLSEMSFRIDSVTQLFGIRLNTDFVVYATENKHIIIRSFQETGSEPGIPENNIKAGWRIKDALGEGKYRIGVIFHRTYIFLLREMSILFGISGIIVLILCGGVVYILRSWRLQKDLSEQKNDFINNLTHELKTPIFSTALLHRVIREKMGGSEAAGLDPYLVMLEAENKKLKRQVEKVLEVAQLDHGKLKMEFSNCDIHALIRQNEDAFSALLGQKKGQVELVLEAEQSTIQADALHMTNVFFNLVDNALKYTEKNPHVRIETKNHSGMLMIRVKDNGMGITRKDQEYVFDKFFRVNTRDIHSVKGHGLGLSYVKMIVELHGGGIRLNSGPGRGATFEIKIPGAS